MNLEKRTLILIRDLRRGACRRINDGDDRRGPRGRIKLTTAAAARAKCFSAGIIIETRGLYKLYYYYNNAAPAAVRCVYATGCGKPIRPIHRMHRQLRRLLLL